MKAGARQEAEGKWHKVKGKVKEMAGKVSMNRGLEAREKREKRAGKAQEKMAQVKKVVGK
jgi:uncharacterized protein YjbJ (UPF0337 family)